MSKQWYITVGYPGGEFALKCEEGDYWRLDEHLTSRAELTCPDNPGSVVPAANALKSVLVRPAPPDVVEWLEADESKDRELHGCQTRCKVPGGWIYYPDADREGAFVPVPLTAGITVLEVDNEAT